MDRSAKIGIEPFFEKDGRKRTRKLGQLVEDTIEKLPALKVHLESIVEAGNKTLHPQKKDVLVFLPVALRSLALESVQAIRIVVEELYLMR